MDQDQLERLELEKLERARARLNQEQREHLEQLCEGFREAGYYAPKHEIALAHVIYDDRPNFQRSDIGAIRNRARDEVRDRELKEAHTRETEAQEHQAEMPRRAAQADAVLEQQRQHDAEARDRQQRDAETTRLILQAAHPNRQREIGRYDELKRMGEEARPDPRPLVSDWRATAREVCDPTSPRPSDPTGLKPTPSPNPPYDPTAARATAQDILDHKTERSDRAQKNPTREDGRENNPANIPTHGRSRGGRTW